MSTAPPAPPAPPQSLAQACAALLGAYERGPGAGPLPPEVRKALTRAFYFGASALRSLAIADLDEEDPEGLPRWDRAEEELDAFATALLERRA